MPLTTVLSASLRPERLQGYEEGVARIAEAARKKKDAFHWTCHQTVFGETGRFHFVSEADDWAAISARGMPNEMIARLLGEQEGRRLLQELGACTIATRHAVAVDRPDLSCPPQASGAVAPLAVVTALRVRPGWQEACEELIRKVAEAIPKVGDPGRLVAYQTQMGDLATYWTVRPLQELSELDAQLPPAPLLEKAFGPAEGGLVFRSGLEAIDRVEREVLAYREELSHPGR